MSRLSVIIATRNRAHLLKGAIESIREATSNCETIVVDDASTDETAAVCASVGGIHYIRLQRNQRTGGARAVGIMASASEYITFLDDDDRRLPGSLDLQMDALDAAPSAGLCYGRTLVCNEHGTQVGEYPFHCPDGDVFWDILVRNFIGCAGAVFRRSCLERVGPPSTAIRGVEDWDLWVRILELYPAIAVPQPVVAYRKATPESRQISSDGAWMVRRAVEAHTQRWMTLPRVAGAPAVQRNRAKRAFEQGMADHLLGEALRAALRGHGRAAAVAILLAASRFPLAAVRSFWNRRHLRYLRESVRAALQSRSATAVVRKEPGT